MSIEAIQRGVQMEQRVTTLFRVHCDDRPSGFIEVSKTPSTGANAMTVTIKPLYGEPFTVNADLLREAVDRALRAGPVSFEEAYREESWRRKRTESGSEA